MDFILEDEDNASSFPINENTLLMFFEFERQKYATTISWGMCLSLATTATVDSYVSPF